VGTARRAWRAVRALDARLVDAALAAAFAAGAAAQLLIESPQPPLSVVSALGTGLPLAWRRRFPVAALLAQIAFAMLAGRQPPAVGSLATLVGLYSVAVHARRRWAGPLVVLLGGLVLVALFPSSAQTVPSWASVLTLGTAVWLAGDAVREHRARADVLAERAEQLERERDLTTQLALAAERQRIARELHDVVAHGVGVMVVQAGAARTLLTRQPPRAAEALLAVESAGREALGELRRLLGLLTDEDSGAPLAPQPGLGQVDRLVERLGRAGLPVDLRVAGTPRPLPAGLDLTAYRVVQEALTNALKHAGGAACEVLVEFGDRELRLEVLDAGGPRPHSATGAATGAGRGLIGMQERVAAYGGELRAGRRPEGGFAVRAWLPLPSRPAEPGPPA
jgi:signal transduction histidine kinase